MGVGACGARLGAAEVGVELGGAGDDHEALDDVVQLQLAVHKLVRLLAVLHSRLHIFLELRGACTGSGSFRSGRLAAALPAESIASSVKRQRPPLSTRRQHPRQRPARHGALGCLGATGRVCGTLNCSVLNTTLSSSIGVPGARHPPFAQRD